MKFKVGDKVKVVKCRTHKNCEYNNTTRRIVNIVADRCFPYELEDCEEIFRDDELELVQEKQFTKADLKDRDIVTYRDGNKRMVIKSHLINGYGQRTSSLDEYNNKLEENGFDNLDIVKVERPVKYETVFERKEEILDETEKRYLAGVIRPFRDKVKYIVKYDNPLKTEKEYLRIKIMDDAEIDFPDFEKNFMYKGMKESKKYTLKELGL